MVEGQDLVNEWNLRDIFAICFLKIVCLNKVYQSLTLRWKHDEQSRFKLPYFCEIWRGKELQIIVFYSIYYVYEMKNIQNAYFF